MIDRKKFFDGVRAHPFGGNLSQGQVDGINAILSEWEKRGLVDLRWLAYMLATAKWETANTMQPIAEYGHGAGRPYGIVDSKGHAYYGRGFVQLTWNYNYAKMGQLLGVDLINHPELALDPKIAADVMFEGMQLGSFTGKKLGDYFNAATTNWYYARQIINGLDRAGEIAILAKSFYTDLVTATTGG